MNLSHEERGRRLWEEETDVSSIAPSQVPSGLVIQRDAQGQIITTPVATQIRSHPWQPPTSQSNIVDRPQVGGSGNAARSSPSYITHSPVGSAAHQRLQGNAQVFAPAPRASNITAPTQSNLTPIERDNNNLVRSGTPKYAPRGLVRHRGVKTRSESWPDGPPLVTTQEALRRQNEDWKRKERQKYLQPLEEGADPNAVGFYLWNSKGTIPEDLLGFRLEMLDKIRIDFQVWIDWQDNTSSLKISSRAETNPEVYVIGAIQALRKIIEHAKATSISATPIYLAKPPTTEAMRTYIRPAIVEPGRITDLELVGDPLSDTEKKLYKQERLTLLRQLNRKFDTKMSKDMLKLASNKDWMRLRVHFGHVVLNLVQDRFKNGQQSFKDFDKMMSHSRASGRLERQLQDAAIAIKLRERILNWPSRFVPVRGTISKLEDVKYKDTEIVFVTRAGTTISHRLEAEIDHDLEDGVDSFNVGTLKFFHDNRRNKMMDITVIDPEKKVDWQMEVISDNTIPEKECPKQLENMLRSSITSKTPQRTDELGLTYLAVQTTAPYSYQINSIVVRSVIQFKTANSGYIVEIAIYRNWQGATTKAKPEMKASVSMFHPAWDHALEKIEKSAGRDWEGDATLSRFYDNGATSEGCGVEAFRDEVEIIQDLLSTVQSDFEA